MPKFFKKNCFFGLERWLSEGKVQEDWISTARTHVDKWCCRAGAIPVLLQKNRRWKQEKLWSTWARTPGRCRKKKQTLKPRDSVQTSRRKDQHLKPSSALHMHTIAHTCLCSYSHTLNPEDFPSFCSRHFLTELSGGLIHLNIWFPVSSCLGED